MPINRPLRDHIKRVLHGIFVQGQRFGVDILPRHFYSSIPDLNELRRTKSWRVPRSMVGIPGGDLEAQIEFARRCCTAELRRTMAATDVYARACKENGEPGYGPVEADFLFCFVATRRPGRVVQVGAGVSTSVMLQAVEKAQFEAELVCIDPYPTAYLRRVAAEGRITLVAQRAQDVDLGLLTDLRAGDLLFVDSTHTVKPGSEVNRIVLEALPRLVGGCYVHFHDVYFPYDYPPSVLDQLFFPCESLLLHAFLACNSRYSIAVSLSMLHHARPEDLGAILPRYRPAAMSHGIRLSEDGHFPSATYLAVRC